MDEKITETPFKITSRNAYRFGTTGGWANNDIICIFGWIIPLYGNHIILGEPDENKAKRNIKKWKWGPRRVCVHYSVLFLYILTYQLIVFYWQLTSLTPYNLSICSLDWPVLLSQVMMIHQNGKDKGQVSISSNWTRSSQL